MPRHTSRPVPRHQPQLCDRKCEVLSAAVVEPDGLGAFVRGK